jgi:hypothetical protein
METRNSGIQQQDVLALPSAPIARAAQSVSRADSTNVCYHPLIWSPKSVPDKYREVAVLLWLLALLERFEDLFT